MKPDPAKSPAAADLIPDPPVAVPHCPPAARRAWLTLMLFTGALVVAFIQPLIALLNLAANSPLQSHILLVPFITAYLVWIKRDQLQPRLNPNWPWVLPLALAGTSLLALNWSGMLAGWVPLGTDRLSIVIIAFLLFFWSAAIATLDIPTARSIAFPLGFLIFLVPLPSAIEHGLEAFLQHGSADVTYVLLKLTGIPILRDGTLFQLPGFAFDVAPECSGIRSSLVLFITAWLAGYFFLQKSWTRVALATSVILLGIFRNAIRIFTLAQLCVHINPDMIHSTLHKRGGPIFFALSLVPFFLLLWFLRKVENRNRPSQNRS